MSDLLLDAFKLPPAQAIAFLRGKGIAISGGWQGVWREANAHAFTVAGVMRADVLQDIKTMCDRALAEGLSFSAFQSELRPRLEAQGWWGIKETVNKETGLITEIERGTPRRLKTIFQNNVQSAYNAGRYKQQREGAAAMPYWQYVSVVDSRTTERCRALHGRIFAADDPAWDTIYPPNHFGCRAMVRTLTRNQGAGAAESSEGRMVTQEATIGSGEDARTVSVTGIKLDADHTYFPQPGWDYNPGKEAFDPDPKKYDADIRREYEKYSRGR